jgi:DNA mismatch repair protein MutS2
MNGSVEQVLEFPAVVQLVRRYLASPLGVAALEGVRPLADRAAVEEELAEAAEAMDYLRRAEAPLQSGSRPAPLSFAGLHDVRAAAARLSVEGAELEPLEILHLLGLLERAGDVRLTLAASQGRCPRLAARGEQIAEFRPLVQDLAGKILPSGELDDHASPALRRIRREIEQQKRAIQASLERFLRAHSEEGSLQEEYVTIRNERLVVPVKAGQKRRIEGVIHAASSSGQTLFVEPLETIDLNNQLVRLAEEELAETRRILRAMTERLAHYAGAIQRAVETMAHLELVFARGRFGREFGAAVPVFSPPEAPRLDLRQARHPLLEDLLRRQGRTAVPLSLQMAPETRVLIISGPNTGGKTVALKTVGLLALMARAGLPVPAQSAEFPWFEQVLADIGDYQSIQDSLSTFSAHVAALRDMMERAEPGSLALLDELGAATDPQEGGALATAIVDHFRIAGAFTLVSTHLPALKVYGANTPGVLSASVGFNEETLEPNYRLTVGVPGKSAGLEIAQRLGLPATVIARAQQALSGHDREAASLLTELHRRLETQAAAEAALEEQRQQLARREKELAREWEKRETAKLRELERRVEAALDKFAAEARETIGQITQASGGRKAGSEASRRVARLERETREDFQTTVRSTKEDARQEDLERRAPVITEGALVRLRGVAAPARVRRKRPDGKLEVEVGVLKLQVEAEDVLEVIPAAAGAAPRTLPERVTVHTAPRSGPPVSEINVIGSTAGDARDRVDKFLDTAVLSAISRVRIVHGHGMGVLRKTLWQMFASHPHVERYYQAEQHEGGAGATIVELRA